MKSIKLTLALLVLTLGMNAQDTYERKFAGKKIYYTMSDSEIIIKYTQSSDTLKVKNVKKFKGISVYDIVEGYGGVYRYRYTIFNTGSTTIKLQTKDDFSGNVTESVFAVKKVNN